MFTLLAREEEKDDNKKKIFVKNFTSIPICSGTGLFEV